VTEGKGRKGKGEWDAGPAGAKDGRAHEA